MTELESLRAERDRTMSTKRHHELGTHLANSELARIDASIAELEREPQRWQPRDGGILWFVYADGSVDSDNGDASYINDTNAFPTEARAQEVATHFKRLGLAAQWGALLTDEAYDKAEFAYYAPDSIDGAKTWSYAFPTAAHRDGFMRDAEKGGLL